MIITTLFTVTLGATLPSEPINAGSTSGTIRVGNFSVTTTVSLNNSVLTCGCATDLSSVLDTQEQATFSAALRVVKSSGNFVGLAQSCPDNKEAAALSLVLAGLQTYGAFNTTSTAQLDATAELYPGVNLDFEVIGTKLIVNFGVNLQELLSVEQQLFLMTALQAVKSAAELTTLAQNYKGSTDVETLILALASLKTLEDFGKAGQQITKQKVDFKCDCCTIV